MIALFIHITAYVSMFHSYIVNCRYSVGRLRPHFFNVCNPDPSLCTSDKATYVSDYNCTASPAMFNNREKAEKEVHLSFPSGHACFSVQAATFTIWYLQSRSSQLPLRETFILPLIQLGVLIMAFYTCISRIMDNKHHPTDVIAGALIGFLIQLFNVVYVTRIKASVQRPAHPERAERNEVSNGMPLQEQNSNNTLL